MRDDARKLNAAGIDPSVAKAKAKVLRTEQLANSFEAVAREWLDKQKPQWSEKHAKRVLARFENDVFPLLGNLPVADLEAQNVLVVLRRVEKRQAFYSAERLRATIGQVTRYAVATGRANFDPVPALRDVVTAHVVKHMASVTEPSRVGQLLSRFKIFKGSHTVKCMLRLAPYVFGRIGELRNAKWIHIDLDAAMWSIPGDEMKMREPHMVPLSRQSVAIFKEMLALSGHLEFVFPNRRDPLRCVSENTLNKALQSLGINTSEELTGHGFRAMARTILHERLGFDPHWIETQISHTKKNPLGRAYDRTVFLEQRTEMMQIWADYLDDLVGQAEQSHAPIQVEVATEKGPRYAEAHVEKA